MKQMNLRSKYVVFVALIVLMTLCLSFVMLVQNNRKISDMAVESVLKLGQSDMNHVDSAEKNSLTIRNELRDLGKKSNYLFLFAAVIVLLLAVLASILFTGKITGPIMQIVSEFHGSAENTLLAMRRMTQSSRSVAEGSTAQAASVEETSSSLEEMAAMTQQNADNVREADGKMKSSGVFSHQAREFMGELTVSIDEILKASEETSKIIKTIDEIAFQTNLLALNASVEAARAGEAGAGFAVVADEVRNLAMRAAEAANTTSQMLEDTLRKVEKGTELVSRTNTAFENMMEGGTHVAQLLGEIAASSSEQATGIEQINKAVAEIDKVIQTNAAGAEETVDVSKEMSEQVEKMGQYVATLAAVFAGEGITAELHVNADPEVAPKPSGEFVRNMARSQETRQLSSGNYKEATPEQIIPMEDFEDF